MTITTSQMYWLLKLDDIKALEHGFLSFCVVLAMIASIGVWIASLINEDAPESVPRISRNIFVTCTILLTLGTLLFTFIPTTKQAAVMLGLPAIVNSEMVQTTIPTEAKQIYGLAKEWLAEQVNAEKSHKK